jgi:hypothetical protein
MSFVLEPCEIPTSICKEYLKESMKEYMISRQNFYKETQRSLYIEEEFSEWFVEKASSGKQIGKGNQATDVISSKKEGIDVMCVIINKNQTNEKSLIQNFNTCGANLDVLFNEKDDKSAIQLFMDDLKKKLINVKEKHDLTDLYILAYISSQTSIYVSCFKYNIPLMDNVVSCGFSAKGQSIKINGFVEEIWGCVKLYKAKKRIELRINKPILYHPFTILLYTIDSSIL